MKKIGVIGGLGPMATAVFMEMIVDMTDAESDQEHIEILLHSKPQIPDRTKYILGISGDSPLPYFEEIGQNLLNWGADIIVIPCMTAHFFQKELEKKLGCCVIDAISETASYLNYENISHVGIMATDGTIKSGLFQQELSKYGIRCSIPDLDTQKKIMHIIYDNVKAGTPVEMELFDEVSDELLKKGVEVILLGCTELSVVNHNYKIGYGYLDAMEVLARKSVMLCATLKNKYNHLIKV
jgi:aspartate racemase